MNTFDEEATVALKDGKPIRVFLDPLTILFDHTDYRRSVEVFVQNQVRNILQSATPDSQRQALLQHLAIEIWGKRTLIVVDVNHHTYDWRTAHDHTTNNLAVYRLCLEKDRKHATIQRDKALDLRVNRQVAELHRLNGISTHPPYLADHSPGADPIQYRSPRCSQAGVLHRLSLHVANRLYRLLSIRKRESYLSDNLLAPKYSVAATVSLCLVGKEGSTIPPPTDNRSATAHNHMKGGD